MLKCRPFTILIFFEEIELEAWWCWKTNLSFASSLFIYSHNSLPNSCHNLLSSSFPNSLPNNSQNGISSMSHITPPLTRPAVRTKPYHVPCCSHNSFSTFMFNWWLPCASHMAAIIRVILLITMGGSPEKSDVCHFRR